MTRDRPDGVARWAAGVLGRKSLHTSLASFVEDAPWVRTITEQAGLAMPNVGTYALCDDLDGVERGMRGTALLGAPALRVRVFQFDGQQSFSHLWDTARSQFRDVEVLAREYGLRVLVETHQGTIVPSASAAARFLEGLDPRHVGVCTTPAIW